MAFLTTSPRARINENTWISSKKWAAVYSSNVKSIMYDATFKALYIEFLNGAVYKYYDIDESKARGMWTTKSFGKWVWSELRRKHVLFTRVK